MDLKAKIELIEILQKKLFKDDSWKVANKLDEALADMVLLQLKEKVIADAKEKYEAKEKKKRTRRYLKQWCKHHNLDCSLLED